MKKESGKRNVTEAKLKKLARYEISFADVFGPEENRKDPMEAGSKEEILAAWDKLDKDLSVKKRYAATPEDLLAALDKAATLPMEQVKKEWARPMWDYGPWAYLYLDESIDGGVEGYPGLLGEPGLTAGIWAEILDELVEEESCDWEKYRQKLQDLIAMRGQAVPLRNYEEKIKEKYLLYYFEGEKLQAASEKERILYVLYADELAAKKNMTGLMVKARGSFGGDAAYACNWALARDLYQKLLELGENHFEAPLYATMLGHIYYNGRLSGGKPDYDKAFYYYSIGEAGGNDEAALRLADMFQKGEGVPKNAYIAVKLIHRQYEELFPFLADGFFDTRFAEAAWRMGEYFRKEASYDEEHRQALYYLLQAEMALQERKKIRITEAEQSLERDISLSLNAVQKHKLDPMYEMEPGFILGCLWKYREKDGSCFSLESKNLAGGRKKVTIRRISSYFDQTPPILLTLPSQSFCRLLDKLEFEVGLAPDWEPSFFFDGMEEGAFYYKGQKVAEMEGEWKLKLPRRQK